MFGKSLEVFTGLSGSVSLIFVISFVICLVLPSVAVSLAAQVPGGFCLSPGEMLEGLTEVSVGLDGL